MEPHERLQEARVAAGYASARQAADAMGVSPNTYAQHENGTRGLPAGRAARYAKFYRVAPEWLLYGRGKMAAPEPRPELVELPLLGRVQAGAWLAMDDVSQDDPSYLVTAMDKRYPHAPQWVREVQGDSMNARNIFPGDLAHIVDLGESGVNLNTGMIVEVVRSRDQGALREITLKEVEITDRGRIVLWPRSTNPRWKDPVRLDDGSGGDIEVQITGLLVAKITRF